MVEFKLNFGSRKVVQIFPHEGTLYALCDDGTIWFGGFNDDKWTQVDTSRITGAENTDPIQKFFDDAKPLPSAEAFLGGKLLPGDRCWVEAQVKEIRHNDGITIVDCAGSWGRFLVHAQEVCARGSGKAGS